MWGTNAEIRSNLFEMLTTTFFGWNLLPVTYSSYHIPPTRHKLQRCCSCCRTSTTHTGFCKLTAFYPQNVESSDAYSEEVGGAHRSYMVSDRSHLLKLPEATRSSRNIETSSRNHYFRAKAISNKYYELMYWTNNCTLVKYTLTCIIVTYMFRLLLRPSSGWCCKNTAKILTNCQIT
jgi:hypothetical protein